MATTQPPWTWASAARQLNTLQLLKIYLAALMVADVLLLIAAVTGTRAHREGMKIVGKDSAPSIIAAQHIKTALADMDANAANEMLGEPGTMPDAVKAYEARRVEGAKALIAAAENITYGDSERVPIQSLQVALGSYERAVQKARDWHERGDAKFVAAYRDAGQLMDKTLLPAADALDKANNDVLSRAYTEQSATSGGFRVFGGVAGLLLVGVLIRVQIFLSSRTRRTLNLPLLAATALAAGFTLYTFYAMSNEQHQLRVAREDAFASIHALWRARAVSYSANADESRYLLDQPNAAEHQRNFLAKAAALAKLPGRVKLQDIANAAGSAIHVEGFSGYLADELNNITFPGEREAAVSTLLRFEEYLDIDARIRALEQGGKHREAVQLCIGEKQGESNWAFDRFDKALGETLDINQRAFDAAVAKGFDALAGLEIQAAVIAAVLAVLIFLGLNPRIREYA